MDNIAILFHRIGPYHFARLRAAGRLLQTTVLELSNKDNTYAWDNVSGADSFRRITLFDQDVRNQPTPQIIQRVHTALCECQPAAVVVNGWATTEVFAAHSWCLKNSVPAVVMSESTPWDDKRVAWKEWTKRRVVRLCSAGLAGGQPHADYLVQLGLAADRIALGYDIVDNNYFIAQSDKARLRTAELISKYGVPPRYFLASARFVEKKNLNGLLEAYSLYRQHVLRASDFNTDPSSLPWSMVLLGDGPLKSALKAQISSLNLREHVLMPGFVQYPDLPAYYGLASAFVHPSTTEQWGLVVNEAMASGLPVLVSNRCGCAQDLVQEGVNGFTFDPFDSNRLAELMIQLTRSEPATLSSFGQESRRIIANWGPDRFAMGLKNAVDVALAAPRPKVGIFDRVLLKILACRRYHAEA